MLSFVHLRPLDAMPTFIYCLILQQLTLKKNLKKKTKPWALIQTTSGLGGSQPLAFFAIVMDIFVPKMCKIQCMCTYIYKLNL